MNQAQMMEQVKKMQAEMAKVQEELANTIVGGSAAGGVGDVSRYVRISREELKIKEAVDPDDIETLEDLRRRRAQRRDRESAKTSQKDGVGDRRHADSRLM